MPLPPAIAALLPSVMMLCGVQSLLGGLTPLGVQQSPRFAAPTPLLMMLSMFDVVCLVPSMVPGVPPPQLEGSMPSLAVAVNSPPPDDLGFVSKPFRACVGRRSRLFFWLLFAPGIPNTSFWV